ncbi:hypothetical protein BP00DRAFT_76911 [Aspergillus indologenus CBS 114.80]|uniref:Uncharacterized protein n=1 Tax=Aspergillus indologenus CBS 114.80 TaxID=1450541 RepID=A0A2V5HWV4_9EURO|nr:hypothetical protein BP00DRAFT_76911 [Aspergillus indologenus CBS 114.80]
MSSYCNSNGVAQHPIITYSHHQFTIVCRKIRQLTSQVLRGPSKHCPSWAWWTSIPKVGAYCTKSQSKSSSDLTSMRVGHGLSSGGDSHLRDDRIVGANWAHWAHQDCACLRLHHTASRYSADKGMQRGRGSDKLIVVAGRHSRVGKTARLDSHSILLAG